MPQGRAARTRKELLCEASEQFDRDGYAGTSLARVAGAAGVSLGALTFHFATKGELAASVVEAGCAVGRELVDRAAALPVSAAGRARALFLGLARALEEDARARAAARLARETGRGPSLWVESWRPGLRYLLEVAYTEGRLRRQVDAATAAALVVHLLHGIEAGLRERSLCPPGTAPDVVAPAVVWDLLVHGVAPRPPEQ
jgi:AcrR family transcriptional regulator